MHIEVFKTNVSSARQAQWLVGRMNELVPCYDANFDLDDCDRILRVKSHERIDCSQIIDLLKREGYSADILCDEVLPDSIPAYSQQP